LTSIRPALFIFLIVVALTTGSALAQEASPGEQLYLQYCAQCHGENGDGKGVAAPYLKPRPRDFTQGKYKIRSTPTGTLPTDDDLRRVIRMGMPYTGMPGWPQFSDQQLQQIVDHIKAFYPGFEGQDPTPIDLPSPPSYSEESAEKGRQVYEDLGCARCHGEQGRGDGFSAPTLTDDWGYHLRPADLTQPWTFRGGASRQDIYRTFMTGLNGTPMPSYADEGALPVENRWPLVDYIYSLSGGQSNPNYSNLVIARATDQELSLENGMEVMAGIEPSRFPLLGQIIQPGRNFYPAVVSLTVRAVYNLDQILILLQWNDMRAEVTGQNSPLLDAPLFDPVAEDALERIGQPVGQSASPQSTSDDPFGQESDPFAQEDDPFAQDPAADALAGAAQGEIAPERSEFSDAVAIQFPKVLPEGVRRPYFLLGDSENAVELWFVDLADPSPQIFDGRGSDAVVAGEGEPFQVSTNYQNGQWSVLFLRSRSSRRSVSFLEDEFVPAAFSVWDGFNRERGNKRSITGWYHFYLEPMEKPPLLGPIVRNSVGVFLALVLVVFFVRRRYSSDGSVAGPPGGSGQ